jgi:hypothetical protein
VPRTVPTTKSIPNNCSLKKNGISFPNSLDGQNPTFWPLTMALYYRYIKINAFALMKKIRAIYKWQDLDHLTQPLLSFRLRNEILTLPNYLYFLGN